MEKHSLMGGRLHVYKRPSSRLWQCSAYVAGKNRRKSTGHSSLSHAIDFAEEWYLDLRGRKRSGQLKSGVTFAVAAKQFEREYEIITQGQRNEKYVQTLKDKLRVYLVPYFGDSLLQEITSGQVQEYRIHRVENSRTGKPPARGTIHQEIVALRQVLKTGQRHGWIHAVPDLSAPFRSSTKVVRRAWFSPLEYQQLYEATRERAQNPLRERWRWSSEQLHDYVLFMANTGLRPDEAKRLEYRDVVIATDDATGETILEIEVRGKRGFGYCKSTKGAVTPFKRLKKRNDPKPSDRMFPKSFRHFFNTILSELNLKFDRDGQRRTAYSLRHTYISLRLMEGADIYQIAKNCRTSVEMIEKHYAAHIKNTLDAAAINTMRQRPRRRLEEPTPRPRSKTARRKR